MKFVKSGVLMLMGSLLGAPVIADTVDPNAVTTFESGTTLSSQAMNTTIQALISAINDNADRIAALENDGSTGSVAGRQYCVNVMDIGIFVPDPLEQESGTINPLGIERGFFVAGVVFEADGTGTLTTSLDDYKAMFPGTGVIDESDLLGTENISWSQIGNTVTLTFVDTEEEEVVRVGVSNNGQSVVSGGIETDVDGDGTWYFVSQLVGIEVDDATTCGGVITF